MRDVEIQLYQTKKIINDHKHADEGWFWVRYSAYPYKGCSNGCRYCYEWDEKYAPMKDYRLLDKVVMVKENAVERLKKELPRKIKDVVCVGDWQPVEAKYRLSRKMLEIVYQLKFPLMIIERAPLLTRDLDILSDISKQTDAYVGFTIVATSDDQIRLHFEPRGPSVKGRFSSMRRIADAGVMIGTLAMPILPYIFDSDEELRTLVKMTADSGGRFVLFGGLTLWGTCKDVYYEALKRAPAILAGSPQEHEAFLWDKKTEEWNQNKAIQSQWGRRCHLAIAEECERQGITHYIPRPVSFFPRELRRNKEIAGNLFIKARESWMLSESPYRSHAFTKAGRAVDSLTEDIGDLYRRKGRQGLLALEGIGEKLASEIEGLLSVQASYTKE
ncbi:hypothetical protein GX441_04330 [bacterium]|nr:hypothetical protein [bacterium]